MTVSYSGDTGTGAPQRAFVGLLMRARHPFRQSTRHRLDDEMTVCNSALSHKRRTVHRCLLFVWQDNMAVVNVGSRVMCCSISSLRVRLSSPHTATAVESGNLAATRTHNFTRQQVATILR